MNNTRKRIERIESGLSGLPCLMCGQMRPTEAEARSEAELRKKAKEIFDALKDEYKNEAQALAAMREVAPTLSSYLA